MRTRGSKIPKLLQTSYLEAPLSRLSRIECKWDREEGGKERRRVMSRKSEVD